MRPWPAPFGFTHLDWLEWRARERARIAWEDILDDMQQTRRQVMEVTGVTAYLLGYPIAIDDTIAAHEIQMRDGIGRIVGRIIGVGDDTEEQVRGHRAEPLPNPQQGEE